MVCELFISIKKRQKTSKNALLQTSELYIAFIHIWKNVDLMFLFLSSWRPSEKGSQKSNPRCLFDRGGEVKSHLGDAHIHRPLIKKRASLSFNKSEQDKMRSQLVKQISIFICLQQTKHICATRILLSSLHHNRLAVFLPAMVQNQSGCFARV